MSVYKYIQLPAALIQEEAAHSVSMCICIPAYSELQIDKTLMSLYECEEPDCSVEVIILINDSEMDSDDIKSINESCYESCTNISSQAPSWMEVYPIYVKEIANKKAGVGLARKLAMDEANRRFNSIDVDGIIVCLDADTLVKPNYFVEIQKFFGSSKFDACSIHFEHILEGPEDEIVDAIILYELHLRYFINMQKLIGLPFAIQTIGSAMAVRSKAYAGQGGMNTRKAGEDFYFLHKFITLNRCGELSSTEVYPSPRVSNRVPFGTGKAVQDILSLSQAYDTYTPDSFVEISKFLSLIPKLYKANREQQEEELSMLDDALIAYLENEDFGEKLAEIKKNTNSESTYLNRFYRWFNAFRLMKCLHYMRDESFGNVDVLAACEHLFDKLKIPFPDSPQDVLLALRDYDKQQAASAELL